MPISTSTRPRRLAVVTCMDARFDAFAALGLRQGEAHVLRERGRRDHRRRHWLAGHLAAPARYRRGHVDPSHRLRPPDDHRRRLSRGAPGCDRDGAIVRDRVVHRRRRQRATVDRPRPQLAVPASPRPACAGSSTTSTRGFCARSPAEGHGCGRSLSATLSMVRRSPAQRDADDVELVGT